MCGWGIQNGPFASPNFSLHNFFSVKLLGVLFSGQECESRTMSRLAICIVFTQFLSFRGYKYRCIGRCGPGTSWRFRDPLICNLLCFRVLDPRDARASRAGLHLLPVVLVDILDVAGHTRRRRLRHRDVQNNRPLHDVVHHDDREFREEELSCVLPSPEIPSRPTVSAAPRHSSLIEPATSPSPDRSPRQSTTT